MVEGLPEYKYYFGAESSYHEYSLKGVEGVPEGTYTLVPWELKHVKSYKETCSGACSTVGLPNKPSECVMIYDTGGAVRNFSLTGCRYDWEEQISNMDFIHKQFNIYNKSSIYPFNYEKVDETVCSIGIEWLLSNLQSTLHGYTFRISMPSEYSHLNDKRVYIDNTGTLDYTVNVGITGFNYSFSSEDPNIMEYTINFAERNVYDNGPIYRQYSSNFKRGVQKVQTNE